MKSIRKFAALLSLLVFAAGCMNSPEDFIVGTWQEVGGTEVLQFLDSGEIIQEDSGGSVGANYRFSDDLYIRVDFGGPAVYAPPRTYRVELSEDTLALTDEKGVTTEYRRTEHTPTVNTDAH